MCITGSLKSQAERENYLEDAFMEINDSVGYISWPLGSCFQHDVCLPAVPSKPDILHTISVEVILYCAPGPIMET